MCGWSVVSACSKCRVSMADLDRLLEEMTLAEKIGQMTQVEKYSITPDDVAVHGIGSVLIEHVEDAARVAGSRRLALDVATDNGDAQRLYERLGMTVEATSPKAALLAGPAVRRMTKPL